MPRPVELASWPFLLLAPAGGRSGLLALRLEFVDEPALVEPVWTAD